MAAIFHPRSNAYAKLALVCLAGVLLAGVGWWWTWPRTAFARRIGFTIEQPVAFSHEHHVAGLGIDCRMCHTSVEVSAQAGLPPTYTCMTCHSQIWTNAAVLAPVRESLAQHRAIAWNRVTNLPDYVYFNHAIHVNKGVGCASCHGPVATMPLTWKAKSMTMAFCLDCHRNPGPKLRPAVALYDTQWRRGPDTPSPEALRAFWHVTDRNLADCSICHR